jgi:hypothetical protein
MAGYHMLKMRQCSLVWKVPAMMAIPNVGLDNIVGYVTNAAEKLSRAPEMSLTKMPAEPGMLAEKPVGTSAFKQLECFRYTHSGGQADKNMDMVCFNLKLEDHHTVGYGNLAQKIFAMFADNHKLKGVLRILWLPHKVERVLSNTMAMVVKSFHHFFVPPRVFCEAHATQMF